MTRRLLHGSGKHDGRSRIPTLLRDAVVSGPSWLLLAVLLSTGLLPGVASGRDLDKPVRLNPALGDTVSAADLQRFGLYGDLEEARQAVFLLAPWGGYLVHLHVKTDKGMVWRERNIPAETWLAWQQRVADILAGKPWARTPAATLPPPPGFAPGGGTAAPETTAVAPGTGVPPQGPPRRSEGGPPEPSSPREGPPAEVGGETIPEAAPADTGEVRLEPAQGRVRVWPEVPLPPKRARRRVPADTTRARYQELSGRWYLLLEAGYKRDVTDFREFFTDQGMFAVKWGRMFGRVMPFFGMEIGFGDLQDDFEELAGNGRGNTYNFELGLLIRQPLGRRTQFYVSGAYGYFIRSMQWGGPFYGYYGTYSNGYVLEQQDWGVGLRAGIQLQRRHRRKARFWDLGVSVQTSPAQTWRFPEDAAHPFEAGGHDTWVTLSLRFGEGL
jgi:hypothetical protein